MTSLLSDRRTLLPVPTYVTRLAAVARRTCAVFCDDVQIGTGLLFAPSLVITSHHVWSAAEPARLSFRFTDAEECGAEPLEPLLASSSAPSAPHVRDAQKLDFAIVRIAMTTGLAERAAECFSFNNNPVAGAAASVIQWHASGPAIAVGFVERVDMQTARFYYGARTLRGASGSPVFNDALELIGIHSGVEAVGRSRVKEAVATSAIERLVRDKHAPP
ncbi:MAG TPA: serine protease [Thermoanaerobaculia bacterium]|nr:serine protease [Thermoanaerobaculia bacterium]